MGNRPSNWDYRTCPLSTADIAINPLKEYPESYKEFMSYDCTWDYYGALGNAYDDTTLTESMVEDIIAARSKKALE